MDPEHHQLIVKMASQPPAAPSPLAFMTRLSPNTYIYNPSVPPSPSEPRLILILGWMEARDAHIAKYISQHQTLFPTSRILLVRSAMAHFIRPGLKRSVMLPAADLLSTFSKETSDDEVPMLIHVFSNGGVSTLVTLHSLLSQPLPRHVLLMDSCPGYVSWQRSHYAFAASLPWWASPFIHVLIAVFWILYVPWGRLSPMDRNAAGLNVPERVDREVRRTYLYGTGDQAVDWRDVERHAAEVRGVVGKEGEGRIRLERFEGGKHVSHVRVDGERYWGAVRETWEARDA